jgi:hypothetical protein
MLLRWATIAVFSLVVSTVFFPSTLKAAEDDFPVELFGLDYAYEVTTFEDAWCEGICASHYGKGTGKNFRGSLGNLLDSDGDYFVALPAQEDALDCLDGHLMARLDDDTAAFRVIEIKPHDEDGPILEATVEDIGPWYCGDDPYWANGTRPASEDGKDARGRSTNCAGIDLSYKLAKDLEIKGIGLVDWRFKKANGEYVVVEKKIHRR